ncbi:MULTISPECIES: response regulator [Kitasatospora]|uniref:Response regulatory domain-containing protein n=1 Tax=Kitasatospora setae (strain ATCC 33774 / DSM 43861 / JCM 3304 / KCC A-0304 / NBRC 14216 / KM-6054) TaxID=452652 RepID=E4NDT8_KITSK|nr:MULTISPECIES: response regulator [Kitasatospora]BAJ29369.1 hypothetical protein KSE_35640 [Kitasatospora setae KM-6054]
MTTGESVFRLLIVDDEHDLAVRLEKMLQRQLADLGSIECEIEERFDDAEARLAKEHFDLVVLDVRDSSGQSTGTDSAARGRYLYDRVAGIRWVPVVFCTAVPGQVEDLAAPPLVQVVHKNRLADVTQAVRDGLTCGVPALSRLISDLVNRQLSTFLRDVIAPNWEQMATTDMSETALVLVHRLSAWLKDSAVQELDSVIGSGVGSVVAHSSAARVYLNPPVTSHLTAADLVSTSEGQWWLVLTPACDLYEDEASAGEAGARQAKVEFVRLARAAEIRESAPFRTWDATRNGKNKQALQRIFRTDHNRYRVLPKYLNIPDLVVDFEDVSSVPLADIRRHLESGEWKRVATLDSPFAEAFLTAHSRTVGRIGTPDIDFTSLEIRLTSEPAPGTATPRTQPGLTDPSSEPRS